MRLFSDAQDSHKQIELLHERRNVLAAFCKLIGYNVFPMIACAKILKYFHQMVRVKIYNTFSPSKSIFLTDFPEDLPDHWGSTYY